MSRHARHLQQLHQRIQDGQIGDIVTMRGYRMAGRVGSAFSTKWPGEPSELLWQIRNFHSFIWASGGCFNDFNIHIVDHCCWMKNAWPVKAQALGGRHYRDDYVDQNFDVYSVEYTFDDGAKLIMDGRCMPGCENIYSSYAHGTRGSAVVSRAGDCGRAERSPYQNEWNDLVSAIRNDQPYNEAERGVMASVVSSLGRYAAHTGVEVTLDEFLNHEMEYAPGADTWTMDSPPPVPSDADGKYPVPQPGLITDREY
jgi:predicted dehydrogenase